MAAAGEVRAARMHRRECRTGAECEGRQTAQTQKQFVKSCFTVHDITFSNDPTTSRQVEA
jgi:hypothetical protein